MNFFQRITNVVHLFNFGIIIGCVVVYFHVNIYRILYKNPDKFIIKINENAKKYAKQDTKRVGNFTAYIRMTCNKDVFKSFTYVEFEGKKYRAPSGYDEWLTSLYGNYMTLPPKEKQVTHHSFIAYVGETN